nr:hypothetical protein [Tanacetum cinerariifolium]
GREDISNHRGLAYKRSEGWDASTELVFRDRRDMPPNPNKVKTETRPRAAHEVPLLTITGSRVIDMEDVAVASESSGTPSTIEKSPLDFSNEDQPQTNTEGGGAEDRVQDEVAYEIPPT